MSDFLSQTKPKAEKKHSCVWCVDPILKGEVHRKCAGVYQGDWQDWRMHFECYDPAIKSQDLECNIGFCEERHKKGKTCQESHE